MSFITRMQKPLKKLKVAGLLVTRSEQAGDGSLPHSFHVSEVQRTGLCPPEWSPPVSSSIPVCLNLHTAHGQPAQGMTGLSSAGPRAYWRPSVRHSDPRETHQPHFMWWNQDTET